MFSNSKKNVSLPSERTSRKSVFPLSPSPLLRMCAEKHKSLGTRPHVTSQRPHKATFLARSWTGVNFISPFSEINCTGLKNENHQISFIWGLKWSAVHLWCSWALCCSLECPSPELKPHFLPKEANEVFASYGKHWLRVLVPVDSPLIQAVQFTFELVSTAIYTFKRPESWLWRNKRVSKLDAVRLRSLYWQCYRKSDFQTFSLAGTYHILKRSESQCMLDCVLVMCETSCDPIE